MWSANFVFTTDMLLNKSLFLKIYIPENVKFVNNGLIREQHNSKINFFCNVLFANVAWPSQPLQSKNAIYNDFVQMIVSTEFLILKTQRLFRPETEVIDGWRKLRNKMHTSYTYLLHGAESFLRS